MNLLKFKLIKRTFKSKWFPLIPQILFFLVFIYLILNGIGIGLDRDILTIKDNMNYMKQLRNTNLANLAVWSYWWPLIIIAAIFFGRIWCMVCPMELITSITSKFGLRCKTPGFFQTGWIITIFYTLILVVAVHTFSIHRVPHRMALFLLFLFASSIISGFIFEKRTFCTYICPVGHLLGLYAKIAPFEWRIKEKRICKKCESKDCISKDKYYNITKRSCTSNLYPAKIENNTDCLVCTQCLKVCPNENIRFSTRKIYADFFSKFRLSVSQFFFVFILSGFVIYEIMVEWSGKTTHTTGSKEVLNWVPEKINTLLGLKKTLWAPFMEGIILFIIFPAVLFTLIVLLARIKSKVTSGTLAVTFAMLLLPTIGASHLNKGILKMTSRIPYWEHTIKDSKGEKTAGMIYDQETLKLDKTIPVKLKPVTTIIIIISLLLALVGSILILFKSQNLKMINISSKLFLLLGVLIYWGIFGVMHYLWRII